jgi:NAD(P)-dependent dehydrogenase (short-subunit alcohol dehydrogenase family)
LYGPPLFRQHASHIDEQPSGDEALNVDQALAARARRILIIGCSDGIGLATTRRLVAGGWQTVGISRSPSPLEAPFYRHEVMDVAAPGYQSALAEIVSRLGPFDACLYCAGIGVRHDLSSLEDDIKVFQVNLMAAVATAAELIPQMVSARRGRFVVLSSQADALIASANPSYAASKAAMSSYFEGLALAARPSGVFITNIRFGFVDTKMAKAPIKPFMRSVDWAADIVVHALDRRAIRVTRPRRMALLVKLLRWVTEWRIRLSGWSVTDREDVELKKLY